MFSAGRADPIMIDAANTRRGSYSSPMLRGWAGGGGDARRNPRRLAGPAFRGRVAALALRARRFRESRVGTMSASHCRLDRLIAGTPVPVSPSDSRRSCAWPPICRGRLNRAVRTPVAAAQSPSRQAAREPARHDISPAQRRRAFPPSVTQRFHIVFQNSPSSHAILGSSRGQRPPPLASPASPAPAPCCAVLPARLLGWSYAGANPDAVMGQPLNDRGTISRGVGASGTSAALDRAAADFVPIPPHRRERRHDGAGIAAPLPRWQKGKLTFLAGMPVRRGHLEIAGGSAR